MSEEITNPGINPQQKKKKSTIGRNQWIAIGFIATPVVMGYVSMWFGKMTGIEWQSAAYDFVNLGLLTVIGASGAIKIAQALKGLQSKG